MSDFREVIADGIVHFDATGPRREAMRKRADTQNTAPHKVNGASPLGRNSQDHSTTTASNPNGKAVPLSAHNKVERVAVHSLSSESPSSINAWKARVEASKNGERAKQPAKEQPISPAPPQQISGAKAGIGRDALKKFLVDFVMEQTGYPEDIVSLDADLEADLGIDSIKIAQMMGEVIEHFKIDIKQMEGTAVEDFKTLGSIIDKLVSTSGSIGEPIASKSIETEILKSEVSPLPVVTQPRQSVPVTVVDDSAERRQKMIQFLIDFVIEQTGYPEDIVTVDAELEADLGIDSIKIAQMIGELNDYFHLNVAALRETSADRYKTIASIVEVVLSVEAGESASVVIERESGRAPEEGIAKQVVDQPNVLLQSSGVNARDLKKFLVDFVIEQTGYPEDIVTLDADLEADLGIDSIKIAQMMGEMNDHFGLSINDYKGRTMDDFKSLDAIISHLTQKS